MTINYQGKEIGIIKREDELIFTHKSVRVSHKEIDRFLKSGKEKAILKSGNTIRNRGKYFWIDCLAFYKKEYNQLKDKLL